MNDQALSLYITAEHPCGYYNDRSSANLIPDPPISMNAGLYGLLVSHGFRRSGGFVYRPHCPDCQACVPCRINVSSFNPNRNQRRCLKKNNDLTTKIRDAAFDEEHFELYRRYMNSRHGDGSMANPTMEDYQNFLLSDWGQTLFIETRLEDQLLSVAVSDQLQDGLSAVYTFFDPEHEKRSLGTFAVLQQIWLAQVRAQPHVYLGYWIENHPKMDYKKYFGGQEFYLNQLWQDKASISE